MSSILNKLKMERSEGMAGFGPDQGALRDQPEASDSSSFKTATAKEAQTDDTDEIGPGKGQEVHRAPNTAGGPSFGRTSMIPRHGSEKINAIDPRIGYDSEDVRREDLERYEAKYGKPSDVADAHLRGQDMAGKLPHAIAPNVACLTCLAGVRRQRLEERGETTTI